MKIEEERREREAKNASNEIRVVLVTESIIIVKKEKKKFF